MLVETPDNSMQKLVLIDAIQRLGVAYHFDNEIKISIQNIFDKFEQNKNEDDDDDLCVVALHFRLVRRQRHNMSSDVFKIFTNGDGKFNETLAKDVQGLLNLYEAAHLRVHREEILEEALTFTIIHLESMDPKLDNSLKAQVSEALIQPIHTNVPRVVACKYIRIYETIESHDDLLLKFAISTFCKRYLDHSNKYPSVRDKLVECYFWAMGLYFGPQYICARRMITKLIVIITITDDLYDAYATYDELVSYTDAIERCDISAMDSIMMYMRPLYQVFIDYFDETEEELTKDGKADYVYYAKIETNKWIRSYLKEAEWLKDDIIPKCEEYKKNTTITVSNQMIWITCLIVAGEFISNETFKWMINESLVAPASSLINRLKDDIIRHEVEYRASKQEAYAEARRQIANAWKDINTYYLHATQIPTFVLEPALNHSRLVDILQEDDFTDSQNFLKDTITLLFVDSVNSTSNSD
ncbi:hypothetical protein H5410_049056 [Solanum commersonii]|uniref:Sesquiterpene synthase n=1 Tax=Solanum commersonii TaxID=4109 RepID=A0A9J5XNL9_SOLCO|nr:hypothetical protein H5410_049056 [Solanum commersonii]